MHQCCQRPSWMTGKIEQLARPPFHRKAKAALQIADTKGWNWHINCQHQHAIAACLGPADKLVDKFHRRIGIKLEPGIAFGLFNDRFKCRRGCRRHTQRDTPCCRLTRHDAVSPWSRDCAHAHRGDAKRKVGIHPQNMTRQVTIRHIRQYPGHQFNAVKHPCIFGIQAFIA